MERFELYKELNSLKSDFDKSYKSLTQNRSILPNAEVLVTRVNTARMLIHGKRDQLGKGRCS